MLDELYHFNPNHDKLGRFAKAKYKTSKDYNKALNNIDKILSKNRYHRSKVLVKFNKLSAKTKNNKQKLKAIEERYGLDEKNSPKNKSGFRSINDVYKGHNNVKRQYYKWLDSWHREHKIQNKIDIMSYNIKFGKAMTKSLIKQAKSEGFKVNKKPITRVMTGTGEVFVKSVTNGKIPKYDTMDPEAAKYSVEGWWEK